MDSISVKNSSEANNNNKVQHLNKKSSDELLRKFAAMDEDEEKSAAAAKNERVKRRRSRRLSGGGVAGEERSLLGAPAAIGTRKSAVLLKKLGVQNSRGYNLKARDFRNKSLFGTIQKTWRRTLEGASKVFVEKHYNRHKRLINDIV